MRTADLDLATLRCEQDGRVLTVRVEAPPFNYMTAAMQEDFVRLIAAVQTDGSVGAVIVTGGVPGRYITHFSIADLLHGAEAFPALPRPVVSMVVRTIKTISAAGGEPAYRLLQMTPASSLARLTRFQAACESTLRSPAVWIAAIDGPCGGGGLELSMFFDIRVATPDARFMLPELSIGLSTTFGGQRLATLIGPARALELMLEADAITAADAEAAGLVNHVLHGDVLARAQDLAVRYARRPRAVVAAQKAVFNDTVSLSESLTREAILQIVGLSSPATRAALTCWLQRQDPSGDSTFLTDPEPWREGTALDMNADEPTHP
jgi:enoyl-CoA hydratase